MTRVRMLVTTAIPALLVGALVGHAAPGSNGGYWNSGGVIVADNDPPKRKRIPPGPPVADIWSDSADTPPQAPEPPHPPHPPRGRHGGVSVSVDGNQINITGLDELVNDHLESVSKMLRNNPRISKAVRDKIAARMDKVRGVVDKRLKNVKKSDLDKLEAEVEKLEGELESALEGLDDDLKELGKQLGEDFAKQVKKIDADDDDDDDHTPDVDVDVDPDPVVIADLDDIKLKPTQRAALQKLRLQSDARVASQKQLLEQASDKLEAALADPKTSTADVERLVDQVSGHEAAIRKARLVAWVEARRLLDADQVKQLEQATGKHP